MSAIEMQIDNENRKITLAGKTDDIGAALLSFVEMDIDNIDDDHPYIKSFSTAREALIEIQNQYKNLVQKILLSMKKPIYAPRDKNIDREAAIAEDMRMQPSVKLYLRNRPDQKQTGWVGAMPDEVVTLGLRDFDASGVKISLEYRPKKIGEQFSLVEVYTVSDLATICYLEFMRMAQLGILVRKCKNCARYFILKGEYDTKYCDLPPLGNAKRTCRQIGATNLFKEKVAESPVLSEYNKIYRRFHSRKRNGIITPDQFKTWTTQAKEIRDKAVADNWTVEQLKAEIDTISI
ncbi:MAG: DUF6076 domain-containing protein [Oscillospiraceae bacterium]|nr:DUF6076 domain-containing protein [Oscillospiraceae bacterium]